MLNFRATGPLHKTNCSNYYISIIIRIDYNTNVYQLYCNTQGIWRLFWLQLITPSRPTTVNFEFGLMTLSNPPVSIPSYWMQCIICIVFFLYMKYLSYIHTRTPQDIKFWCWSECKQCNLIKEVSIILIIHLFFCLLKFYYAFNIFNFQNTYLFLRWVDVYIDSFVFKISFI